MIETERLRLRPWRDADKPGFAAIINTPAMMAHFGGVAERAAIDRIIDGQMAAQAADGCSMWAIEMHDGTLAGICGVRWQRLDRALPVYGMLEIGWRVAERLWGKGIAREAAEASLDWAWTHTAAPLIAAWTVSGNRRSWGLMERLGMRRRPDLDFDHPAVPMDSVLRHQVVYAIDRPARRGAQEPGSAA